MMPKGKQKIPNIIKAAAEREVVQEKKTSKIAVEEAVNEGVKLQDAAGRLTPRQAITNLQAAEAKYKSVLVAVPGHAEASYNLATCLSEQADVRRELVGADAAAGEQIALLSESQTILTDVINRDTSGRGATTALAHHALGNVIGSVVDLHRGHCPTPSDSCPLGCLDPAGCKKSLRKACRHFEDSLNIHNRQPNPPAGMDDVVVHWGDAEASMMRIAMEGNTVDQGEGVADPERPSWQPPPLLQLQEALGHCSNACNKYAEALNLESSSGGSDTETLLSRAGVVVDFLDWALPEILHPDIAGPVNLGFDPFAVMATGDHAVGVLLGLDASNRGGLLAKADLSRLRARAAMLAGANLLEEGKWREASVQAFATAVSAYPDDTETLASAGEGSLEYGRRGLEIYRRFALAATQPGVAPQVYLDWDPESMRASALARLQEAGVFLSRSASSAHASETDSIYNAACAFALCGNEASCREALTEYFRRVVSSSNTTTNSRRSTRPMDGGAAVSGDDRKKEDTKRILSEAREDSDLEAFKNAVWFVGLTNTAESAVVSEMQPWQSRRYMGL